MAKDEFDLLKDKKILEEVDGLKERLAKITANPKELDRDFLLSTLYSPLGVLKEKKIGKFAIETEMKRAEDELTVVSHRNWIMMGYKPLTIKLAFNIFLSFSKSNSSFAILSCPFIASQSHYFPCPQIFVCRNKPLFSARVTFSSGSSLQALHVSTSENKLTFLQFPASLLLV